MRKGRCCALFRYSSPAICVSTFYHLISAPECLWWLWWTRRKRQQRRFVPVLCDPNPSVLLPPAVSPPPATLHTVATGTNLHTATPCPKTVCPTVLRGNLQMEVGSPGSSNPPSSGLDLLTRSYQTISTVPWCLVAGTPEYAGRPVAGVGAIIGTPCTQWGRPWPPLSPPPSSQPSLLCPLQQRRSESLQSEFVRKRCKFVPASANINHDIEL